MVLPWNDYSGRLSPLKLVVFVALFIPAGGLRSPMASGCSARGR